MSGFPGPWLYQEGLHLLTQLRGAFWGPCASSILLGGQAFGTVALRCPWAPLGQGGLHRNLLPYPPVSPEKGRKWQVPEKKSWGKKQKIFKKINKRKKREPSVNYDPGAKGPASHGFGASIQEWVWAPHPEAWAPWLPAVTAGCLGCLRLVKHQKRQNKNWEGVIENKGDEKKIHIVSEPPPS